MAPGGANGGGARRQRGAPPPWSTTAGAGREGIRPGGARIMGGGMEMALVTELGPGHIHQDEQPKNTPAQKEHPKDSGESASTRTALYAPIGSAYFHYNRFLLR